eukprot:CAMPEP_0177656898 /NCGR_PEP_ID=MMETSP0447-20121125/15859_1 /TAXON_ID=0 /ORGANISM="Stygamoeba regulata, Strain BSH-02190019" /LENGTH=908 /DNA_ID=CAMNT_0019161141 /DNA_START=472 /DNA_END=3199 /DNA_ORIENTATION=-
MDESSHEGSAGSGGGFSSRLLQRMRFGWGRSSSLHNLRHQEDRFNEVNAQAIITRHRSASHSECSASLSDEEEDPGVGSCGGRLQKIGPASGSGSLERQVGGVQAGSSAGVEPAQSPTPAVAQGGDEQLCALMAKCLSVPVLRRPCGEPSLSPPSTSEHDRTTIPYGQTGTATPCGFLEFFCETDFHKLGISWEQMDEQLHAPVSLGRSATQGTPPLSASLSLGTPSPTKVFPGCRKSTGRPVGLFVDPDEKPVVMKQELERERARERKEKEEQGRGEEEGQGVQTQLGGGAARQAVSISEPKEHKKQPKRPSRPDAIFLPIGAVLDLLMCPDTDRHTVEAILACHTALMSTHSLLDFLRSQIDGKAGAVVEIIARMVSLHPALSTPMLFRFSRIVNAIQSSCTAADADMQKKLNAVKLVLLKQSASGKGSGSSSLQEDGATSSTGASCLDDLSPKELVQWLTAVDYKLYCAIPFQDMLYVPSKRSKAIENFVQRSNKMSYWVASRILSYESVSDRTECISRFIDCLKECVELQNFNSFMVINAGLHCLSISRLKRTWELLGSKQAASFELLQSWADISTNYQQYRGLLESTEKPTVPFLGIFLRDLTFLSEGKKFCVRKSCEELQKSLKTLNEGLPNDHDGSRDGSQKSSRKGSHKGSRVSPGRMLRRLSLSSAETSTLSPSSLGGKSSLLYCKSIEELPQNRSPDVFKSRDKRSNSTKSSISKSPVTSPIVRRRASTRVIELSDSIDQSAAVEGDDLHLHTPPDPPTKGTQLSTCISEPLTDPAGLPIDEPVGLGKPTAISFDGTALTTAQSLDLSVRCAPISPETVDTDGGFINLSLVQQIWPILRLFMKFQNDVKYDASTLALLSLSPSARETIDKLPAKTEDELYDLSITYEKVLCPDSTQCE